MEYCEQGLLEELLALRRESWETNVPMEMSDLYSNGWSYECFGENPETIFPNSFYEDLNSFNEVYSCPLFGDEFLAPQLTDSSINTLVDTPPFPSPLPLSFPSPSTLPFPVQEEFSNNLEMQGVCKMESPEAGVGVFNMGMGIGRKNTRKKLEGQPSKNLMAERRRRKRLNDRLSMLRSIVPKISKMDRTSILGDTIDYMKELLDKINALQQDSTKHLDNIGIFKQVKPNEILVRNTPKFDVERKKSDTRIEICCAGKPGLLLSTVTTLEALGLEIQQCVVSCFNDFSVQASCSEEDSDQMSMISCDDIKQALFRNAGYGGRCL